VSEEKTVSQKMHMKAGHRVLTVNAPRFYATLVGGLPDGARVVKAAPAEVVHLFVKDRAEITVHLPLALAAVGAETLLWVSYPKKSSGVETDISRDEGWEPLQVAGWEPVSLIAIDDTWSALRFKRTEAISSRAGRTSSPNDGAPVNDPRPKPVEAAPAKSEGRAIIVPADFAEALAREPRAKVRFDAMSLSHRREYVDSIEEAARPETRVRRIAAMLEKLLSDAARQK
jgi:Bacteriocin-protection, YdeI or OmpD-Associated